MKHLTEFRDPELVQSYLNELHKITARSWNIMEVCGGQTHSLVKNGILSLLPKKINIIHGPGCPVCVTPLRLIDKAIYLAAEKKVTLCSFGDMLRVPGSKKSLLDAKAEGADVRILYSPLEAVTLAEQNPEKDFVFFAVGFETTAPANAISVLKASKAGITNYSILTSHVIVPPVMQAVIDDEDNKVDAFLAAGHVCTIMGLDEYFPINSTYNIPIVATGFEPVDLLQGILMAVRQLEAGTSKVENQYRRMVKEKGNKGAIDIIEEVFELADREWRGIGNIPLSGYELREKYKAFDANLKFKIDIESVPENKDCIAGEVLKGKKKPHHCSQFGKACTPSTPLGAPMVSSEGACAAYFHYFSNAEMVGV